MGSEGFKRELDESLEKERERFTQEMNSYHKQRMTADEKSAYEKKVSPPEIPLPKLPTLVDSLSGGRPVDVRVHNCRFPRHPELPPEFKAKWEQDLAKTKWEHDLSKIWDSVDFSGLELRTLEAMEAKNVPSSRYEEAKKSEDKNKLLEQSLDEAFRFIAGLSLIDHPVALQREQIELVRRLQKVLRAANPEKGGK